MRNLTFEEEDRIEFREFCEAQERIRQDPTNAAVLQEHCAEPKPGDFTEDDLIQVFSLFVIFLLGVLVRLVLRRTHSSIPYTVVLMVIGLLIGLLGKNYCEVFHNYTAIARIKPQILLLTFLPVLIFESAFSISVHTFMKSAAQILIVSLPGMLMSTFLTAGFTLVIFEQYHWSFVEASLFGSIISATDPVAVVAVLRELGASQTLTVLIEGESLLNDGVGVLLFEIFKEILESGVEHEEPNSSSEDEEGSSEQMVFNVGLKFIQIAIGGPIFGFIMGKVSILSLKQIYNDSTVEFAVTLSSAFLTFFIGEEVLGVSGIMAVVVLGITLSSGRTCISPEAEETVKHFWEMLGYLANTVLFVLIGMIIGERALGHVTWIDGLYLGTLYGILFFVRLVMLTVLRPLLNRCGDKLEWKNLLIMSWGGLRGGVGLCLALETLENIHLCEKTNLGPKVLFQTSGIVFLTLVINATTTKKLMEVLKVTKISNGRKAEMENTVKLLCSSRKRALAALKSDWYVADCDWNLVDSLTRLQNPYEKNGEAATESKDVRSERLKKSVQERLLMHLVDPKPLKVQRCKSCQIEKQFKMTLAEHQELTEEARIRILQTLKTTFWRQYQQGVLKGLAVQILVNICEKAEDSSFKIIGSKDIRKYLTLSPALFPSLKKRLHLSDLSHQELLDLRKTNLQNRVQHVDVLPFNSNANYMSTTYDPSNSKHAIAKYLNELLSRNGCKFLMDFITISSLVLSVVEIVYEMDENKDCNDINANIIFLTLNGLLLGAFGAETLVKVLVDGRGRYIRNGWHYVELLTLALVIGDIFILGYLSCDPKAGWLLLVGLLKGLRLLRCWGTVKNKILHLLASLERELVGSKMVEKVFLGYDIGKGFITGVEQTSKLIPLMPDESGRMKRVKRALEMEKVEVVRELGRLQRSYPDVAIGAKTRHACRAVLNQMRQVMEELVYDGLVDNDEHKALDKALNKKIKKLLKLPSSIPPPSPQEMLMNISWFEREEGLGEKMMKKAKLLTLVPGDVIYSSGDPPKGVYVIVSGMVKIQFSPLKKVMMELRKFGVIPNCELLSDLSFLENACDVFSSGTILGEIGFLKNQERAASATCETFVSTYHFSMDVLNEISTEFLKVDPKAEKSLEAQVWRSWGLKVATALLQRDPDFDNWSLERIQGYLERSCTPVINPLSLFHIPDIISEVFVIEGHLLNYDTREVYMAPCIVPRSCSRMLSKRNPITVNRILVVAHEDVDFEECFSPKTFYCKLADELGNVDGFTRHLSYPTKLPSERLDIRQRRLSVAIASARLDETPDELEISRKASSFKESKINPVFQHGINSINPILKTGSGGYYSNMGIMLQDSSTDDMQ